MSVKNNIELIENVSKIKIEVNDRLVSFDVVGSFPSIPIKITIGFLKVWLSDIKMEKNKIKELINLTSLCMRQNFFISLLFYLTTQFNEQTTETAMGNPLSPFLAEVFMSKFETDNQQNSINFPETWIRYVDNIFAIVDKNFNIEDFLDNLYSL